MASRRVGKDRYKAPSKLWRQLLFESFDFLYRPEYGQGFVGIRLGRDTDRPAVIGNVHSNVQSNDEAGLFCDGSRNQCDVTVLVTSQK